MEASKKRFSRDTERNTTPDKVSHLKKENDNSKKAIADLYLHNELLKKCNRLGVSHQNKNYMRFTPTEKFELIQLVERNDTAFTQTLQELGIHKSMFYNWYNLYLQNIYDRLLTKPISQK